VEVGPDHNFHVVPTVSSTGARCALDVKPMVVKRGSLPRPFWTVWRPVRG